MPRNPRSRDTPDTYANRQSGEGLPPARTTVAGEIVWLFTCTSCGFRETDPPAPLVQCSCGGDVFAHRFDAATYERIRESGDPRP